MMQFIFWHIYIILQRAFNARLRFNNRRDYQQDAWLFCLHIQGTIFFQIFLFDFLTIMQFLHNEVKWNAILGLKHERTFLPFGSSFCVLHVRITLLFQFKIQYIVGPCIWCGECPRESETSRQPILMASEKWHVWGATLLKWVKRHSILSFITCHYMALVIVNQRNFSHAQIFTIPDLRLAISDQQLMGFKILRLVMPRDW